MLLAGLWAGYPWVEPPYADSIARFARIPTGAPTIIHLANATAVPHLATLLSLRVMGLLAIAWFALEAEWERAAAVLRLNAATTTTLALFSATIVADFTCVVLPLLALAVEMVSLGMLRRWHESGEIAGASADIY
ncbi:hypothetical protein [Croceicoccus hydrothermalis]|uniref:hypothetical protein n=1 Tax=Croceicoccus hydrothermalis TaxID=2867964 RepID=UPI001EFB1103|nr:hypothetical protein [Croceicoccus hydrothermalis]